MPSSSVLHTYICCLVQFVVVPHPRLLHTHTCALDSHPAHHTTSPATTFGGCWQSPLHRAFQTRSLLLPRTFFFEHLIHAVGSPSRATASLHTTTFTHYILPVTAPAQIPTKHRAGACFTPFLHARHTAPHFFTYLPSATPSPPPVYAIRDTYHWNRICLSCSLLAIRSVLFLRRAAQTWLPATAHRLRPACARCCVCVSATAPALTARRCCCHAPPGTPPLARTACALLSFTAILFKRLHCEAYNPERKKTKHDCIYNSALQLTVCGFTVTVHAPPHTQHPHLTAHCPHTPHTPPPPHVGVWWAVWMTGLSCCYHFSSRVVVCWAGDVIVHRCRLP